MKVNEKKMLNYVLDIRLLRYLISCIFKGAKARKSPANSSKWNMVLGNLGNLRAAVTAERHIADVDVPKELPARVSKFIISIK